MILSDDGNYFLLSSGKEFYAYRGKPSPDKNLALAVDVDFTPDEKKEIALYMITRWQEWVNEE